MSRPTGATRSTAKEAASVVSSTRPASQQAKSHATENQRSKSRSPSRNGPGLRNDPFAFSSETAPTTIKRKRSFTPVRPSTAATVGDDIDRGQRIKPSAMSSSSAQPRVSLAPSASSSHRPRKERERSRSVHAQLPSINSQTISRRASDKGKGREVNKNEVPPPPGYSGPIAAAEYERMRKELEALRKTVHDNKKLLKKQTKTIDELKAQVTSETMARETAKVEHEKQLAIASAKSLKNEELLQTIQVSLQCQICIDLVTKPYAVVPCGHVLCLGCLQQWFRSAPSGNGSDDGMDETREDYILTRDKSCPCCRARVTRRPIPMFVIKSLATALRAAAGADAAEEDDADPWAGLFLPDYDSSDDEEFHDYASSEEDYGAPFFNQYSDEEDMALGMSASAYQHELSRFYGSSSASGSEDGSGSEVEIDVVEPSEPEENDSDDEQDEDEGADSDADHPAIYSFARWEPPSHPLAQFPGVSNAMWKMQRRGCTTRLALMFNMRYTHDDGLVLHVNSMDATEYDVASGRNRLLLGWNISIDVEPGDADPEKRFVARQLRDIQQHPGRWVVTERHGYTGRRTLDARRLAPVQEDADVYDTSDSEAYM